MNKEIMELIEPYMDKTLSIGCWIRNKWKYYIINNIEWWQPSDRPFLKTRYCYCKPYFTFQFELPNFTIHNNEKLKIIWHYDITWIIKYIKDKLWSWDCYIWEDFIDMSDERIPNKPLSLYSTKEEISLLELLLKLK